MFKHSGTVAGALCMCLQRPDMQLAAGALCDEAYRSDVAARIEQAAAEFIQAEERLHDDERVAAWPEEVPEREARFVDVTAPSSCMARTLEVTCPARFNAFRAG